LKYKLLLSHVILQEVKGCELGQIFIVHCACTCVFIDY